MQVRLLPATFRLVASAPPARMPPCVTGSLFRFSPGLLCHRYLSQRSSSWTSSTSHSHSTAFCFFVPLVSWPSSACVFPPPLSCAPPCRRSPSLATAAWKRGNDCPNDRRAAPPRRLESGD